MGRPYANSGRKNLVMDRTVSPGRKAGSSLDALALTESEKRSMERVTAAINAEARACLQSRPRRYAREPELDLAPRQSAE